MARVETEDTAGLREECLKVGAPHRGVESTKGKEIRIEYHDAEAASGSDLHYNSAEKPPSRLERSLF
jgi:hypothetical protein